MSSSLAEYLAALEARDEREQAHAVYVNAYTKLADRTAAARKQAPPEAEQTVPDQPSPSPSLSSRFARPGTPRGKSSPAPQDTNSPTSLAQLRAELGSTQKTRSTLEAKLAVVTSELSALQTTDSEQKKRIAQLEHAKDKLERRVKDGSAELREKGQFGQDAQDEILALNAQLNMVEGEKERLKRENERLTRQWVERMEVERRKQSAEYDQWEAGRK